MKIVQITLVTLLIAFACLGAHPSHAETTEQMISYCKPIANAVIPRDDVSFTQRSVPECAGVHLPAFRRWSFLFLNRVQRPIISVAG
jgi:hypothetical protein